jgi:hypothetical protein
MGVPSATQINAHHGDVVCWGCTPEPALTQQSCHQPSLGRITAAASVFWQNVLSGLLSGNDFVRSPVYVPGLADNLGWPVMGRLTESRKRPNHLAALPQNSS